MWSLFDCGKSLPLYQCCNCSNIPSLPSTAEVDMAMLAKASRLVIPAMNEFLKCIFKLERQ